MGQPPSGPFVQKAELTRTTSPNGLSGEIGKVRGTCPDESTYSSAWGAVGEVEVE